MKVKVQTTCDGAELGMESLYNIQILHFLIKKEKNSLRKLKHSFSVCA